MEIEKNFFLSTCLNVKVIDMVNVSKSMVVSGKY
jgi:hypothetical protein